MESQGSDFSELPVLDLSLADAEPGRSRLLSQLHGALFDVGFLYLVNHGVSQTIIDNLICKLPTLFELPRDVRSNLTKLNSPHFLGYSGFAEETTLGKQDLREQFDFATELPVVWTDLATSSGCDSRGERDFSKLFWRLRGPNQWPPENLVPGFRQAYSEYHDAVATLSYRFVNLVEEAFGIPVGTFDEFWNLNAETKKDASYLPPQHRIKLLKYPPAPLNAHIDGQGVGPHKDSSGWITFLYQVGTENALEVVNSNDEWISVPPIKGSFVVNFGNGFEAATEGAVRATIHRVKVRPPFFATTASSPTRYSIPFFQGLPLDLTVSEIRNFIPAKVRELRKRNELSANPNGDATISSFLDKRWDSLGESQLRKWFRSHEPVARKWYADDVVDYYLKA